MTKLVWHKYDFLEDPFWVGEPEGVNPDGDLFFRPKDGKERVVYIITMRPGVGWYYGSATQVGDVDMGLDNEPQPCDTPEDGMRICQEYHDKRQEK